MALKPRQVLEIGTHIGGSSLCIACALKNTAPHARVTTVDIADVNDPHNGPWKKLGLPMPPARCAERLGCLEHIEFKSAPSLEFMAKADGRFDMIFLDGDHASASVYKEVSGALELVNEGGMIILHDYYPGGRALFRDHAVISGPYRAMERIRRENSDIAVRPLGAPLGKQSRARM